VYSLAEETLLEEGKLLTTLPALGREWRVTLQLRPTVWPEDGHWLGIIQLTQGGANTVYGDRTPGIYYQPDHGLSVSSAVNSDKSLTTNITDLLPPVGKWTALEVSQELVAGQYMYSRSSPWRTFSPGSGPT
jgi:hypothetical protein